MSSFAKIYNFKFSDSHPPGYPRMPIPKISYAPSTGLPLPTPLITWPPESTYDFHCLIDLSNRVLESGLPNYLGLREPVMSNINIFFLRSSLQNYYDYQICDLLEFGFPLGFSSNLPPVSNSRNHSGAFHYPNSVDEYIVTELDFGATMGPFKHDPFDFPWPCAYSPLNTVPKKNSSKRRIIVDLSWPIGAGVNFFIPKDSYLGDPVKFSFPTVDDFCSLIRTKGKGCLLYKLDLSRAYRQLPICPGDIPLMGFSWRGDLYFDRVLAFGLRSAALCCQRVSNVFRYLMELRSFDLLNYMDDFAGAEVGDKAYMAFHYLRFLFKASGIDESFEKAFPPNTNVEFLGILFDSLALTMSITNDRLLDIKSLLSTWLSLETTNLRDLQSLIGKLQFVAKCVRPGRLFLSRILKFLSAFENLNVTLPIPIDVKKDIAWWFNFIDAYNGVSVLPFNEWSQPDSVLATDACLVGGGGVFNNNYFHFVFSEAVLIEAKHINSLELLTITVALKLFGEPLSGFKLQLFCDNSSSVSCINSGRTKDPFMQKCLRELVFLSSKYNVSLFAIHLPGVENRLPDLLSRWAVSPVFKARFLALTAGLNFVETPCPSDLVNFTCNW